jgi:hypothetical protein
MILLVEPKVDRRMNKRMEKLLPTLRPRPIPADVETDLRMGIAELGPYLLLRSEADRLGSPPQPMPDATGAEAFFNHVHPNGPGWSLQECAEAGMAAFDLLRSVIIDYEQSGPVQLTLGVGYHEIPSSTLRFYRRRPGEIWLTEDLEKYETEAILVEDIR